MHLRQLLEFAGLVSTHSLSLIESAPRLPREPLERYWSASHARMRLWMIYLADLPRTLVQATTARRNRIWEATEPILVDVLAGELITRLWGAVLISCDRRAGRTQSESLARSVFVRHLCVRQELLHLMVDGLHLSVESVSRLDRVRRRIERWNDLLVGQLVRRERLDGFAFNVDRACDFGDEQLRDIWGPSDHQVWDLYLTCLRSAGPATPLPTGKLEELRDEILHSILACFPPDLFHSDGQLQSVRLQRLLRANSGLEGPPDRLHRPSGRELLS